MIRIFVANDANALTDVSAYVNLQTPRVVSVTANAEEQTTATSGMDFEDPTGVLNLTGLRNFAIEEDAATFKRIFTGQLWDRHITRGVYRAGSAARVWKAEINDLNTRMDWRVGEGNVNRPAETDVERMQYLITQLVITDIVQDVSTYFDTSAPVAMDAANYEGQHISDYIQDCLEATGKNCYLLDVVGGPTGYQVAIWYGPSTLTTFSSSAKISNVLSDVDGSTVFAPYGDAELVRSPSRVFSGERVNYDGGAVYRTRGATASVFFATRDTIYDAVNVKTLAKASARGDANLITISSEDDVITCTILVPAANVNDIRNGMRVQAKFSHFTTPVADYSSDYVWFRVLNRTVTLIEPQNTTGAPGLYEIGLTLSPQATQTVLSCSAQLGALTVTEVGPYLTTDDDLDSSPATPSAFPAVVMGGLAGANGTTGTFDTTITGGSPYTQLFHMYSSPSNMVGGYYAMTSGVPPVLDLTTTGGPLGYTHLWTSLATSATSPVQAPALTTGSTVTFSPAPTEGNIGVFFRFSILNGGTPNDGPAGAGWTLKYRSVFPCGGIVTASFEVWARCFAAGESATVQVGSSAFSHWNAVSEWALT